MTGEEKTTEQLILELEGLRKEVAELKLAESERNGAEERHSMLVQVVEQVGEGVASSDLDGKLTFVNRVFAVSHGYEPDELIGRHLSMFHTPEQLENDVKPFIEEVKCNGFARREVGHKRRDGTLFLTDMTATLMRDGLGNLIGMTAAA